jgi:hypothetical protein
MSGFVRTAKKRYDAGMAQPDFQPTLTGPTVIVRPVAAT